MKQNVKNLNIIALSLKIKSTSWKDLTVFDSVNVFLALHILEIRSFFELSMQSTKPSVSLHCYICSRGSTSGENAGTKQGQTVNLPERINHYKAIHRPTD